MSKFIGIIGLLVFIGIAFLFSENKKKINWRLVGTGLILQVLFALFVLKVPFGRKFFDFVSRAVTKLLSFTKDGSVFLFGDLADSTKAGHIFAFQILPVIIFFSALMGVLYYLGIMQIIISTLGRGLAKLLGTSGAETLSAVANIFLGQTEAPLVIKPYVKHMTRSELLAIMTGGMATVAGSVMAGYISMGVNAGHLMAASIMAAPIGLVVSKILIPETEEPLTKNKIELTDEAKPSGIIEAAANGAAEGLHIALNVGAMLIAFVALIALLDFIISSLGGLVGADFLNLGWIFGKLFSPIAFLMGVPNADIMQAGNLLGQKLVINEFVAYSGLSKLIKAGTLNPKTIVILTYALCGFANFSSVAIQIGGISSIAQERRTDIAKLGMRALLGGTITAFITATVAGLLY